MPMNAPYAQPTPHSSGRLTPFAGDATAGWAGQTPPVGARTRSLLLQTVDSAPGIGKAAAGRLAGLGIHRLDDLIAHLPARYLRYDDARPLGSLQLGEEATINVTVTRIGIRPTRQRRLRIIEAAISDTSGAAVAIWFNQDYLARTLEPGSQVLLRGTLEPGRPPRFKVKTHELVGQATSPGLHTEGLVPVYPATESVPPRRIREMVDWARPAIADAVETLPLWIRRRLELPHAADAYMALHFPRNTRDPRSGRRRLVLEELIVMQIGLGALRRQEALGRPAPALRGDGELRTQVRAGLPFTLTHEQDRVVEEIARDLRAERPMRRLLQGEVGSGKTVVAALAMCQAIEAGRQAALLVPTETLAEQHLRTLDHLLGPVGITPVLMTGKVPKAERERRRLALRTGTAPIAVGTQALLSEADAFQRLGLVVVDEQHRFGVEQRQALADRATDVGQELAAHLLYMTATPIPRTLAITAYGDLQVSTIRGRPPGRAPVETLWIREAEREAAYDRVRAELRAGRQAYVICPLVESGEAAEARAATDEAARLQAGPFSAFRVGLAHGAQKSDEKRAAMSAFASGQTDLLVATTVVEVGIDVPNATVIMIEGADRFGIAQLHQLRGRVGRGTRPGMCLLLGEPTGDEGIRRLEALTQTTDGFRLAELDLDLRGEGTVLGTRQSGATDLRFARLARDRRELAQARQIARRTLREDPRLTRPEHALLRAAVEERFHDIPRLLDA